MSPQEADIRPGRAAAVPASIIRLDDVGSTNDEAMARLREGGTPLWVTAARQLSGRGRRGRLWVSEPGNLYASFAFNCALPVSRFGFLPLAAAVALAEAIEAAFAIPTALKWPNDVLVDGRKAAGILIETELSGRSGADRRVVMGFGVNVAHHPETAPTAFPFASLAPAVPYDAMSTVSTAAAAMPPLEATHLAMHRTDANAESVFAALRPALADVLTQLCARNGLADLRERWLARAIGIGGPITVRFDAEARDGTFAGLDPDGRLLLDTGGAIIPIAAGDVFVRTAP